MSHSTGDLDLSTTTGAFEGRWFNPRTGVFVGATIPVTGGSVHPLGAVPSDPGQDWVYLLKR